MKLRRPSSRNRPAPSDRGVILLQIDGLSRHQFERGLRSRRLPYLRKLIGSRGFQIKSFYSGQPSCTPAVQAEIHFGARSATPAFSFYDAESKQDVRMYDSEWARRIAQESSQQSDPLLEGGSSYANIYTGGAKKAKYCGELNTFSHWISELSLLRLAKLAALKPLNALRIASLLFIEIWLALYDAIKGAIDRGEIGQELMFIPARIAVAIGLREAIRGEVLDDIKDGLPIIHANFFGYDEAAHRRGPHSRFAHWTLRGIDQTIKSIVKAAAKSPMRSYECIVFADHGQESVVPYHEIAGHSIFDTTRNLFCDSEYTLDPEGPMSGLMERSRLIASGFALEPEEASSESKHSIHLNAMGPVAHVYVDHALSDEEKEKWARRYCADGHVPIVLYKNALEEIVCRMDEHRGDLSLLARSLEARRHQFPEQTIRDLEIMLASRYTGDLVLLGWRPEEKPITFADERGAHAGPGAQECHAFAVLPPTVEWAPDWMRPLDLRQISLKILGRSSSPDPVPAFEIITAKQPTALRVSTYNVHGGVGVDRRRDMQRLASVIDETRSDIICFQEAFEGGNGSPISLRRAVRDAWGADCHFEFLTLHRRRGIDYGLAIASKLPFRVKKSEAFLVSDSKIARREPRGAMWIEVNDHHKQPIQIVNTHFGLNAQERDFQSRTLLGEDWLAPCDSNERIILCGDLNAGPRASAYQILAQELSDALLLANGGRASASFLSWAPLRRIDHIFSTLHFHVPAAGVLRSRAARRASDHLPVFADMEARP